MTACYIRRADLVSNPFDFDLSQIFARAAGQSTAAAPAAAPPASTPAPAENTQQSTDSYASNGSGNSGYSTYNAADAPTANALVSGHAATPLDARQTAKILVNDEPGLSQQGNSLSLQQLRQDGQNGPHVADLQNAYNAIAGNPEWLSELTEGSGSTLQNPIITPGGLRKLIANQDNSNALNTGEIGDSRQSGENDCGPLSAINAVKNTPEGSEQLASLVKSVPNSGATDPNDFHYEVIFPGDSAQQPYTVTKQELQNADPNAQGANQGKFTTATGDLDTRVLEIAADKYARQHGNRDGSSNTGLGNALQLLTGRQTTAQLVPEQFSSQAFADTLRRLSDNGENPVQATVAVENDAAGNHVPGDANTLRNNPNLTAHGVSVSSVNSDGTVTYVDPQDSSQPRTVSLAEFQRMTQALASTNLQAPAQTLDPARGL